jgi:hypothetical protein
MASVIWSTAAEVGGIPIIRDLSVYLHPVRLQLEERVAAAIKDYIFNDRVSRRKAKQGGTETPRKDTGSNAGSKASSTLELAPLHRSKSAVSVNSNAVSISSRSVSTSGRPASVVGDDPNQDKFTLVPKGDAEEMRRRANGGKTFLNVAFDPTVVVISYKVCTVHKRGAGQPTDSTARRQQKAQAFLRAGYG